MPVSLHLEAIEVRLAVCRLDAFGDVPPWVDRSGAFTSVTRTSDELSVVCAYDDVPEGVPREGPWRAFRVQGPIVMTLIGVVAALANALADAGISIFADLDLRHRLHPGPRARLRPRRRCVDERGPRRRGAMSEQGWREFLAADGVDDWVVLHGGATAVFKVGSIGEATRLAVGVAAIDGFEGSGAVLTIVDGSLTCA